MWLLKWLDEFRVRHRRRVAGVNSAALANESQKAHKSAMSDPESPATQPDDAELARFLREELGVDAAPVAEDGWTVTAPLRIWRSKGAERASAAWYFLTVTGEAADAILRSAPIQPGAWGSVKVAACIGSSEWRTSVFRSKELGGYMLPVKAAIRKAEKLVENDAVTVTLTLA